MSISSIGSSGSFDPTQMADRFFKKADANNDGGIDKSELKTMLSKGPNGKTMTDAQVGKLFSDADTNGDGKIDETENAALMKKMGSGKPPAGAPSSGGAQQSTASAGSSSSADTKTYDKKDANKDGRVSSQEELMYDLKHPAAEYTQKGSLKADTSGTQSLLNLSA